MFEFTKIFTLRILIMVIECKREGKVHENIINNDELLEINECQTHFHSCWW